MSTGQSLRLFTKIVWRSRYCDNFAIVGRGVLLPVSCAGIAFVSVDPKRDTPQVLKEYIAAFDPRMIALTGTDEQIRKAAEAYGIFYREVALEDGSYTVDHSASALLLSADGKLFETIAFDESDDVAKQKIARLLGEAP